ncbi:universal stress protein [Couchioplanes caeruleus]|uniref:universal stress protein n=1 Tax=Couchioplanes caeruleus TaxID=56438 RepID=UPI0020BF09BE|nr:universal stress protein [Couchioplanes caeruleus]UQU67784.1 universal stress protein [Couchioplanes caeruleus]
MRYPGRQDPIVVGVDGSPGSKAALRGALRLADRSGAEVEAVSVWRAQPTYSYGAEWAAAAMSTGDDLAADTERMLLDTLVEVARRYGPSAPIRPRVLRGRPADELLRAARSAQLLALGGPARGTVAGLLLGSVSHRCVQRATCPVLVIPAEAEPRPSRYGRQTGTVTAPWA